MREYRQLRRQYPDQVIQFVQTSKDLGEAISRAVLSESEDGILHPHQHRIGRRKLRTFENRMLSQTASFQRIKDFDSIYALVKDCTTIGDRIGELACYDIAHRIGAFLKIRPDKIYLHAGTRVGARKLGLSGKTIEVRALPLPLRSLTGEEAEDCLCIFSDHF